jgi:hypothetical protein
MELDGELRRERYEVLGCDADSVAIRTFADSIRKELRAQYDGTFDKWMIPTITHINFCRDGGHECFWIGLGKYCEWFRKIEGVHPTPAGDVATRASPEK